MSAPPVPPVSAARHAVGDHVPVSTKVAYGAAGPVDIWSVWLLVSIAYPLFNMEMQLSPTKVAVILMGLRLWDGLMDPLMGWISDNTRTRWGRRRPYIFVGAIGAALTFPLMWWFPLDWSGWQLVAWVLGTGILFYSFFTVWAMPYQSLLMEMTPDYNERTRIAAVRGYFQSASSLVVGFAWWLALRPVFADPLTGAASTANGMRYISIFVAFLILILGILPALFVRERYYEGRVLHTQRKIPLRKSLRETFSNRPFLVLCAFTVFFLLGTNIYDSYGRYVGTYYVLGGDWERSAEFQVFGTLIYTALSLLAIPLFRAISLRVGKKRTLNAATLLVLLSGCSTWFTFNPDQPYWMLANSCFIGIGYAGLWLMIPSMQADVVDDDELTTHERREGSFAAIYSWVLKIGFCVSFLLSGPLLELTGFDVQYGADQPAEVLQNMRLGFVLIPVLSLLLAVFLLRLFSITPERALQTRRSLEERRGTI